MCSVIKCLVQYIKDKIIIVYSVYSSEVCCSIKYSELCLIV